MNEIALDATVTYEEGIDIKIYPNPFSSSTTLITNTILNNANLVIYNILGQELKTLKNISGTQITINRGNLADGLYFYTLTQDNRILATGKLIAK